MISQPLIQVMVEQMLTSSSSASREIEKVSKRFRNCDPFIRNGHRQKKGSVASGEVQESDVVQEHILEEVPRADEKKPKHKKGTEWAGGIFLC